VTKVLDWRVPLTVGGQNVRASGTLLWDPEASSDESDGFPFVAVGAVVLALVAAAVGFAFWRGRRRLEAVPEGTPDKEAW
jgi:hypothetical protein